MADLAVQLEAAEDRRRDALVQVSLTSAERQVIDAIELNNVGAVIESQSPVELPVTRVGERSARCARAGAVVAVVEGARPRITEAELSQTACVAVQLRLQGVVVRAPDGLVQCDAA